MPRYLGVIVIGLCIAAFAGQVGPRSKMRSSTRRRAAGARTPGSPCGIARSLNVRPRPCGMVNIKRPRAISHGPSCGFTRRQRAETLWPLSKWLGRTKPGAASPSIKFGVTSGCGAPPAAGMSMPRCCAPIRIMRALMAPRISHVPRFGIVRRPTRVTPRPSTSGAGWSRWSLGGLRTAAAVLCGGAAPHAKAIPQRNGPLPRRTRMGWVFCATLKRACTGTASPRTRVWLLPRRALVSLMPSGVARGSACGGPFFGTAMQRGLGRRKRCTI